MNSIDYSGSPWTRFGCFCGIAMAAFAFRIGNLVDPTEPILAPLTVAMTLPLNIFFTHELFRQSRPIIRISVDLLTWQPKALWHPEISVPLQDIVRVNRKWSRQLSVKLRDGTTHRIDLSGIAFSARKSISNEIKSRIQTTA